VVLGQGIEVVVQEVDIVVVGLAVDTVAVGCVSGIEEQEFGRWTAGIAGIEV
jgi:hypothetical protein